MHKEDINIKFDKPDLNNMNWKQIFDLYDKNFDKVYDMLQMSYNKFIVESFNNLSSNTIKLVHSYVTNANSLLVFKNGVIQLKDENYTESSRYSIEMLENVLPIDKIDIIILDIRNNGNTNNLSDKDLEDTLVSLLDKMSDSFSN